MRIFVVGIFALIILVLGSSCEEYIIENTIDTVYIDRPIQGIVPSFITVTDTIEIHTVDTVEIKVVIHETDTLIQYVVRDSTIIKEVEKVINHYDTIIIVQRDTVIRDVPFYVTDTVFQTVTDTVVITEQIYTTRYLDTLYVSLYYRTLNHIPSELQPAVIDFYAQANARGWNLIGGPLVVQYSHNMAGENWNSFSYWIGEEQMVIEVNGALDPKFLYSSVLRELGRLQLKKKYVTTGDLIMNVHFPPEKLTIDSPEKEKYLRELFKVIPI